MWRPRPQSCCARCWPRRGPCRALCATGCCQGSSWLPLASAACWRAGRGSQVQPRGHALPAVRARQRSQDGLGWAWPHPVLPERAKHGRSGLAGAKPMPSRDQGCRGQCGGCACSMTVFTGRSAARAKRAADSLAHSQRPLAEEAAQPGADAGAAAAGCRRSCCRPGQHATWPTGDAQGQGVGSRIRQFTCRQSAGAAMQAPFWRQQSTAQCRGANSRPCAPPDVCAQARRPLRRAGCSSPRSVSAGHLAGGVGGGPFHAHMTSRRCHAAACPAAAEHKLTACSADAHGLGLGAACAGQVAAALDAQLEATWLKGGLSKRRQLADASLRALAGPRPPCPWQLPPAQMCMPLLRLGAACAGQVAAALIAQLEATWLEGGLSKRRQLAVASPAGAGQPVRTRLRSPLRACPPQCWTWCVLLGVYCEGRRV